MDRLADERGLDRAPEPRGPVLVSERVPGSERFAKNAGSRAQAQGHLLYGVGWNLFLLSVEVGLFRFSRVCRFIE